MLLLLLIFFYIPVGSPIKTEEKFIQHHTAAEDYSLDIEDSIPTAFLVQKPQSGKNAYNSNSDDDKSDAAIKTENDTAKADVPNSDEVEIKEDIDSDSAGVVKIEKKDVILSNNLEELKKIAESVIQPWETKENDAKSTETPIKEEKVEIKDETNDPDKADTLLNTLMSDGKWFSILRKESAVLSMNTAQNNETENLHEKEFILQKPIDLLNSHNCIGNFVSLAFCDNTTTCSEIILTQGNRWDIVNNLHLLNNPNGLFSNSNGIHNLQPINTTYYHADSSLTMSGLDQEMIDASFIDKQNSFGSDSEIADAGCNKDEAPMMDIICKDNIVNETMDDHDCSKSDISKVKIQLPPHLYMNNISNCNQGFMPNFSNVNLSALTAYVSCDSPAPIQMTPEESEQLEFCKINGLPKKLDGTFVTKDFR